MSRRIGTRLLSVHVFDVVRRRVAVQIPAVRADSGLLVRRAEGDDLLVDAARVGSHPLAVSLAGVPVLGGLAMARRLRRFRRRVAKGKAVYIATAGDHVAGWAWLSGDRVFRDRWIGLQLHFEEDERYVYDLWVYPAFRDTGAGALLMAAVLRDLQRDGRVEWLYGLIDRDNRPNQLLQRLVFGFETVQSVSYVRILVAFGRVLLGSATPTDGPCRRAVLRPTPSS